MAGGMTKEWLVKHCKQRGLYQTPYLNDRLYLQCQAICDIQNLEEYTGVKLLYLEENCLESMDGIQPLKQLQCIYLRRNFIKSIDYLDELKFLDTLDISQNYIRCLENLSKCLNLRVLVVSHNQLDSIESIAHLTSCPSIMILDLSHNKLKDGAGILEIAMALPRLAVLYLSGNPCISRMPHYRKNIIGNLTKLTHLDDRPVFWDERLYAEAWLRGGQDAETAERDRVRDIRAEEETKQFESMRRIRDQCMEERLRIGTHQFIPSELGEEETDKCHNMNDIGDVPEDEATENTKICSEGRISGVLPGETVTYGGPVCSFPTGTDTLLCDVLKKADGQTAPSAGHSRQEESPSIILSLLKHKSRDSLTNFPTDNLDNNPLYEDTANEMEEQIEAWNPENPSTECHSACSSELVGSDIQRSFYIKVRNNTLFSASTMEKSDDSKSQPTESLPLDHESRNGRQILPTLHGHGRDGLASLAISEMGTFI